MGFYIQTTSPKNKAQFLVDNYNCSVINEDIARERADNKEGVVVVVDNGPFEAVAFAYDKDELARFLDQNDNRPKTIVAIDYDLACKLSGFNS